MTHTENYNLNMPDNNDFFDVEHMNDNMEAIDTAIHDIEVRTETVAEKIGSYSDAGNTTVMGKLNTIKTSVLDIQKEKVYRIGTDKVFTLVNNERFQFKEEKYIKAVIGTAFKCEHSGYLTLDVSYTITSKTNSNSFYIGSLSHGLLDNAALMRDVAVASASKAVDLPSGTYITDTSGYIFPWNYDYTAANIATQKTKTVNLYVKKGSKVRIVMKSDEGGHLIQNLTAKLKYSIEEI